MTHFNRARDVRSGRGSKVDISRVLFDGLNKLQTEWVLDQADQQIGEVKGFQLMILDELWSETRSAFLRSPELQSVVSFRPEIMNHDILRRGGYRPGVDIEPRLVMDSSEIHRKLANAYWELDGEDATVQERVLKRAAELLYIVRSNIAHGEKTPYGPDIAKRERDEAVCSVIVPLQELLLDFLLDRPSTKLVAYGTLAPGSQTTKSLLTS